MGNTLKTLLFLLLLTTSGCATVTEKQSTAQAKIERGVPVVYIHPASLDLYRQSSICIPPFWVPSPMAEEQAGRIAGLFKDVLLGQRTFPTVKLVSQTYGDLEQAIEVGRQAGTDLVLAGTVNYAVEGTELGGARVELAVRIINVGTGNTVWYIGQNMDQPMDYPDNSLLHRATNSLSPPPVRRANGGPALANMLSQIAVDMANVMAGARTVRR